jgi:hypothetical protein
MGANTSPRTDAVIRRYWPIILALVLVGLGAFVLFRYKQTTPTQTPPKAILIGSFAPRVSCARLPQFVRQLHLSQPILIDLSQKRHKGIALLHGANYAKVLHPKQWEQFEHFSTYALDRDGNIYLVPTPFISIRPTTFSLQQKLFRLDTHTGKIAVFMDMEEVHSTPQNPYGLNAVAYDCDDGMLWLGAIDESDYAQQRGVIYRIDPRKRTIVQRVRGFDALTLALLHTRTGKYLLAGSARDNGLYAYAVDGGTLASAPQKILEIPNPNEHIRKIKIRSMNHLELQTIPFSYSLIAQSAAKDRVYYDAYYEPKKGLWTIKLRN